RQERRLRGNSGSLSLFLVLCRVMAGTRWALFHRSSLVSLVSLVSLIPWLLYSALCFFRWGAQCSIGLSGRGEGRDKRMGEGLAMLAPQRNSTHSLLCGKRVGAGGG